MICRIYQGLYRRKMEQIQFAYGLPKEIVAAIRILYRNIKVKARFQMETQTTSTLYQVYCKEIHNSHTTVSSF